MKLFICLLLVAAASAIDVKFVDCGSALAKIETVDVTPCDNPKACSLKRGSNYTVTINFKTASASKNIKAVIHGIIAGVPVPFPFDNSDACQKSGLTCPLANGGEEKYTATLAVLDSYPTIQLPVKWELVDTDANKDLVCIEMGVSIVGAGDGYEHPKFKVARNGDWIM